MEVSSQHWLGVTCDYAFMQCSGEGGGGGGGGSHGCVTHGIKWRHVLTAASWRVFFCMPQESSKV